MSNIYTIVLTEDQKAVLEQALARYAELHLGQTVAAKQQAQRIELVFKHMRPGTTDLSKNMKED